MTLRSSTYIVIAVVAIGFAGAAWVWMASRPSLEPARALLAAGRREQAESVIREYLRTYPRDVTGHFALALSEFERLDQLDHLDKSLALDVLEHLSRIPNEDGRLAGKARLLEGKLYDRFKRFDKMESAWRAALDLDPSATEAGWLLLQLYDLQGRRNQARQLAFRLYHSNPSSAHRARVLMEIVRQDVHHPAAAEVINRLSDVVKTNPGDVPSAMALGRALIREGRSEEGLSLLRTVVEYHSDRLEAWDALLSGLEDGGLVDALVRMLALAPKHPEAAARFARYEGWLAQERGDWPASAAAYRRAMAADPSDPRLDYRLSRVLRLAGERAEADRLDQKIRGRDAASKELRAVYERTAAEVNNGSCSLAIFQEIARLLEQLGRADEALAWHVLVLLDRPEDPLSLAAAARLKRP